MTQFYDNIMPRAFAGMKADSRFDLVETATAGSAIPFGAMVSVDANGVATVFNSGNSRVVGIALHSHTHPNGYQKGDAVSVLRKGAAWVKCENDVSPTIGNKIAFKNGMPNPNGTHATSGDDGWVVRDVCAADGVKLALIEFV